MKITISGSLGNIGKHLAPKLVKAGHDITVISSSSSRKSEIEALGARAAIGSVDDAGFLKQIFAGQDAVFTMTPPNIAGTNVVESTTNAGKAYAEAIKVAGVKRVVMLSSLGADFAEGTGPIVGLHNIEQIYGTLDDISVTFLRAGYFYNNYYNDVPMIKNAGIIGGNFPASTTIPLVDPQDIATAAAEELQKVTPGKNIRYVVSDIQSAADLAKILGFAIDKPDLPWVEFTDEQFLSGLVQAGLPEEVAGLYTEMGSGFRDNKIHFAFEKSGSPVEGKIKLIDFAKIFAKQF